jgi:hypothetical protein
LMQMNEPRPPMQMHMQAPPPTDAEDDAGDEDAVKEIAEEN